MRGRPTLGGGVMRVMLMVGFCDNDEEGDGDADHEGPAHLGRGC